MEKLDYKKAFKDLYMPKAEPAAIQVPPMQFLMVEGQGNPNTPNGEYAQSVGLLYALAYTIKMSKAGSDVEIRRTAIRRAVVVLRRRKIRRSQEG